MWGVTEMGWKLDEERRRESVTGEYVFSWRCIGLATQTRLLLHTGGISLRRSSHFGLQIFKLYVKALILESFYFYVEQMFIVMIATDN